MIVNNNLCSNFDFLVPYNIKSSPCLIEITSIIFSMMFLNKIVNQSFPFDSLMSLREASFLEFLTLICLYLIYTIWYLLVLFLFSLKMSCINLPRKLSCLIRKLIKISFSGYSLLSLISFSFVALILTSPHWLWFPLWVWSSIMINFEYQHAGTVISLPTYKLNNIKSR